MKIELFQHLYNGLLRFSPLKKYFKYISNQREDFPLVGFLDSVKIEELNEILGIQIKNIGLFEQALLHRSYLPVLNNQDLMSNERLEFLGDSILGMIVAEYLFSLHSHVPEGELTKMRSWLVNSSSLALCAKKIGLDKYIMLSFSAEKSLVQGSDSILADALEAIIAAIYLDWGLDSAKKFIINSLLPIEMNYSVMKDNNFKSILLERVQAQGFDAPKYTVIEEFGPAHDKLFKIAVHINEEMVASGLGKNKKQAEQSAAKNALDSNIEFLDS